MISKSSQRLKTLFHLETERDDIDDIISIIDQSLQKGAIDEQLWHCLQHAKAFKSFQFFRHAEIEKIKVDFYCPQEQLVIYIENNFSILEREQVERFRREGRELESKGYRVMYIQRRELEEAMISSLQAIKWVLSLGAKNMSTLGSSC